MSPEAVAAVGMHDEVLPLAPPVSAAEPVRAQELPFARLVSEGLQGVDAQLRAGQTDLQRLAVGEATSLHEVMVRLEESRIAFQLMLQVRNRALEAYQEVMRMQI